MSAGYGAPTLTKRDDKEYIFGFCNDDNISEIQYALCMPKREVYLNVGSAAVAGAVAGVIGTVVSLSILIPLTPILAPLGVAVGA